MTINNQIDRIEERLDSQGQELRSAITKLTNAVHQVLLQFARSEERCINLIEENKQRDIDTQNIKQDISKIKVSIGVNRYVSGFTLKTYFALFSSFSAGLLLAFGYFSGLK